MQDSDIWFLNCISRVKGVCIVTEYFKIDNSLPYQNVKKFLSIVFL